MSAPSSHAPAGHPSHEDGVDMKKIIIVGVVSLVTFAVSALIAWFILRGTIDHLEATQGRPPPPSEIGKDEIGIVDQPDFAQDRRLDEWRAAKRKRLGSYGWSNRDKNLIHIPIDRAIDELVSRAAAGAR